MKYDNVYQHNLRLNLDKKEHLQAHRYLMNVDTKRFDSKNEFIVQAILKGAERLNQPDDTSIAEINMTLSEEQMGKIASTVVETMKAEVLNEVLKTLLSMVVSNPNNMNQQTHVPTQKDTESVVEDYLADAAMDYFEE